jgi:hypothetical protein
MTKVTLFWNPNDPGAKSSLMETQSAAKALSIELQILETREVADFHSAFRAAAKASAAAVILLPAPVMSRNATRIVNRRRTLTPAKTVGNHWPTSSLLEIGGVKFLQEFRIPQVLQSLAAKSGWGQSSTPIHTLDRPASISCD